MKPDAALPAYCNPPNPCPVGYTGMTQSFTKKNRMIAIIIDMRQMCIILPIPSSQG